VVTPSNACMRAAGRSWPCACRSMNPGETTSPAASSTVRPCSGVADTASIRPPRMPMDRTASSPVSGSMTRPLATTRSYPFWAADVTASSVATAATSVIARVDMVTVAGAGMEDLRNQRRRLYFDVFRPRRVWRITSAGPLEFSSPWHGGLEHWWWQHDRGAGRPRDLRSAVFRVRLDRRPDRRRRRGGGRSAARRPGR
jgi:hypothetical protein